jgi:hypothetical protein
MGRDQEEPKFSDFGTPSFLGQLVLLWFSKIPPGKSSGWASDPIFMHEGLPGGRKGGVG